MNIITKGMKLPMICVISQIVFFDLKGKTSLVTLYWELRNNTDDYHVRKKEESEMNWKSREGTCKTPIFWQITKIIKVPNIYNNVLVSMVSTTDQFRQWKTTLSITDQWDPMENYTSKWNKSLKWFVIIILSLCLMSMFFTLSSRRTPRIDLRHRISN